MEEDGFSQCPKHFSKRGFVGVCPFCLYERLSSLCPDCAKDLPCSCSSRAASCFSPSSSSSSSSSFSGDITFIFSGTGSVCRVASLIECEPAFRRSKSMAVPIKPDNTVIDSGLGFEPNRGKSGKASSFWRMFMGNRGGRDAIMRKSRSVAVVGDAKYPPVAPVTGKGKGWSFPSPSKVFRQSKMIFQQRSPLYRG